MSWLARVMMCLVLATMALGTHALAATFRDPTVTPTEATSNSIYTFRVTWEDGGNLRPDSGNPLIPTLGLRLVIRNGSLMEVIYIEEDWHGRGEPSAGRVYTVRLTAGLNRANAEIPGDDEVEYCSILKAQADGSPAHISYTWVTSYNTGSSTEFTDLDVSAGPTIHDSFEEDTAKYGGMIRDRDYLESYSGPYTNLAWDPLNTTRWDGQSPDDFIHPDDGTGSSTFDFRVVYSHEDNLPPVGWFPNYPPSTGVALYLAYSATDPLSPDGATWEPYGRYNMTKEDPEDVNYADGVIYTLRFAPTRWSYYRSLPTGWYRYFYACSDDYIRDENGAFYDPNWVENPMLDRPSIGESSFWYGSEVGRWSLDGTASNRILMDVDGSGNPYDFIDRPTFLPGIDNEYPFPSISYPFVNVALWKYPSMSGQLPSTTETQYCGTLTPLRLGANPDIDASSAIVPDANPVIFRVSYFNANNTPPREISVWVDNTNDGSGTYTRYNMTKEDISDEDYTDGVDYVLANRTGVTLPRGGHTYYFTTNDALRYVRYPAGTATYFRGPFVNTKPVLENLSVTPSTGHKATRFVWRVRYTDANNQPPYQADLIIRPAGAPDDGSEDIRVNMIREDMTDNTYTDGCVYYFDSGNLREVLPEGEQHYWYEFKDNWGRPTNPQDRVEGELVILKNAGGVLFSGPYIRDNNRPLLVNGAFSYVSSDRATCKFAVKYLDADNDAPSYVNVYIGEELASGQIDWWLGGYTMERVRTTSPNYVVGEDYQFTIRLPGDPLSPKDYWYCFVASDGADVAVYDAVISPSAHTIWDNPIEHLTPTNAPTNTRFQTTHYPLVGEIPLSPTEQPYRWPIVYNATGQQLEYPRNYTIDFKNGVIQTTTATAFIEVQYWFALQGPLDIGANTHPTLSSGQVTPTVGTSSDTYVFSVTYTDADGNMPSAIRVIVDNGRGYVVDSPMTLAGGTNPRSGIEYRSSLMLPPGAYSYYFTASDGYSYAVFDAGTPQCRTSDNPITLVTPIAGPYINDPPTLSDGRIDPTSGITPSGTVNYSVVYTDGNNEAPDTGYPIVFIDNPNEVTDDAVATAVTATTVTDSSQSWTLGQLVGKTLYIISGSAAGLPYTIVNNTATTLSVASGIDLVADGVSVGTQFTVGRNEISDLTGSTIVAEEKTWTADRFAGKTLYITSGNAAGNMYPIVSNTGTTLTVRAVDLVLDGVDIGDSFVIGKIPMVKDNAADTTYTDGVLYEVDITRLAPGSHTAHFKSITTETISFDGQKRLSTARYPTSGEMQAPTVDSDAPTGNTAPVLSSPTLLVSGVAKSSPAVGRSDDTYTFKVTYVDAQGHAPGSHDGVRGYVHLVIGDSVYVMTPESSSPNYQTGAVMTYTPSLPSGTYKYHFEAFDGWAWVRLPSSSASDYTVTVNKKPVLSSPSVTPLTGNEGQSYVYQVTYTDGDNVAPQSIKLIIDGNTAAAIDLRSYAVGGTSYANGVVYSYTLPRLSLAVGTHNYYFTAADNYESAANTPVLTGPNILTNRAPTLSNGSVSPSSGDDADVYTYSVKYTDLDGDAPEYVKVYIDGQAETNGHLMDKDAGSSNYQTGVVYRYQTELLAGSHNYFFKASDWRDVARLPASNSYSGPTVSAKPTATITIGTTPSSPVIGDTVSISGTVTGRTGLAMTVTAMTIRLTRPNGSVQEVDPTITAQAGGTYRYAYSIWIPNSTGVWKLQALWNGDSNYKASQSSELSVNVGPTTTVTGLDMISIPLSLSSGFPEAVFGSTPPFALAKWVPWKGSYKIYSLLPQYDSDWDFPMIEAGEGYWIKTEQAKTIAPSGNLIDPDSAVTVPLRIGWNQVGCPFYNLLDWSSLRITYNSSTVSLATAAANGWVREYGWTYNPSTGNYDLVDATRAGAERTMRPWRGYWMKALVDCDLVMGGSGGVSPPPPPLSLGTAGATALSTAPGETRLSDGGWLVRISAVNGDLKDEHNCLGASRSSEHIESPLCIENYVDLYFTDEKGGVYASDLRANISDGDEWRLNVVTDRAGEVKLTWDGMESIPSGARLQLVDETEGVSVNIATGGSYRFQAGEGITRRTFRVVFRMN